MFGTFLYPKARNQICLIQTQTELTFYLITKISKNKNSVQMWNTVYKNTVENYNIGHETWDTILILQIPKSRALDL